MHVNMAPRTGYRLLMCRTAEDRLIIITLQSEKGWDVDRMTVQLPVRQSKHTLDCMNVLLNTSNCPAVVIHIQNSSKEDMFAN